MHNADQKTCGIHVGGLPRFCSDSKPQEDTANVDVNVKIQLEQNFLIELRWSK